jgi:hypothetical protein
LSEGQRSWAGHRARDLAYAAGVRIDRRWVPLAAVVGVAVALAAVIVPLALARTGHEAGPGPGGSGQPTEPAALPSDPGAGVPVEGQGTLYRDRTGPIRLCASVISTLDLPPSSAGCDRVAVPTTGVDESWLVNTTTGGQAYSVPVRVEGTFHNGTLAVNRVVAATPDPPPAFVEPPVPCEPPAGGWIEGRGEKGPDDWMGLNRLTEYVRARPDRFADIWEAHPDGAPTGPSYAPSRMVYAIGTTGDVAQALAELRPMWPGNLCVYRVSRNAQDLERLAQQLRSSIQPMSADIDVIQNKVRVKVVALDPATVAVLDAAGRDAIILEEPLLQWLE